VCRVCVYGNINTTACRCKLPDNTNLMCLIVPTLVYIYIYELQENTLITSFTVVLTVNRASYCLLNIYILHDNIL